MLTETFVFWWCAEKKDLLIFFQFIQKLEPIGHLPCGIAEIFLLVALCVWIVVHYAPHTCKDDIAGSHGECAMNAMQIGIDDLYLGGFAQVLHKRYVLWPRDIECRQASLRQ